MIEPAPYEGRREEAGVPRALRGTVSRVLRSGLVLSVVLIAVGVVSFLAEGIGPGTAASPLSLRWATGGASPWSGAMTFASLGLLVLLLTPMARVAVSSVLFATRRDLAFTGLTLIVLTMLAATVAVGILG